MQNGRALRDAPLVVGATLLIAASSAYWLAGARYDAIRAQLGSLQDQAKDLREQLQRRGQAGPLAPARDPDGIYQFDVKVGTVLGAHVDEARGMASFDAIVGAVKFNEAANFEYRDFVLTVKSVRAEANADMAGQTARKLIQVSCAIVGRVPRR